MIQSLRISASEWRLVSLCRAIQFGDVHDAEVAPQLPVRNEDLRTAEVQLIELIRNGAPTIRLLRVQDGLPNMAEIDVVIDGTRITLKHRFH